MSLVTPAPMPARGAKDQLFEIQRNDFMAPEARGRMGGITAGFQRALVRLMEPANADSGGNLHATIEPAVPVVVPANAIAHLDNPACLMKLNPQTSKLGAVGRRGAIESGTIEAVQDIVP